MTYSRYSNGRSPQETTGSTPSLIASTFTSRSYTLRDYNGLGGSYAGASDLDGMGGLLVYGGLALTRGDLADGPVGATHDLAAFDYEVVILLSPRARRRPRSNRTRISRTGNVPG